MVKVTVDLNDELDGNGRSNELKTMAASSQRVSKANSSALKNAPRVQFSFTNVPRPIKEAFATEAQKRGITQKELLYECLRSVGINIPDASGMDGRRK